MTEIDAAADIDIVWEDKQVRVRIPLAGQVSQEWCRRYQAIARRENVPTRAEVHPSRAWVLVELPDGAGRQDIEATLDAARDLITAADAAEDPPDAGQTDSVIRGWWAGQRG
jgi:hypothetical protein